MTRQGANRRPSWPAPGAAAIIAIMDMIVDRAPEKPREADGSLPFVTVDGDPASGFIVICDMDMATGWGEVPDSSRFANS